MLWAHCLASTSFSTEDDGRPTRHPTTVHRSFGGDIDNFEWPRHTADFTLLRAYVAPDGSAAEPDTANVPYKPERYLRASTAGASEGDFAFLLGFPGHTMRYAPTSRLAYSREVAVPALVTDFGEKLALIKKHATERATALKLASAKKGLANEHKCAQVARRAAEPCRAACVCMCVHVPMSMCHVSMCVCVCVCVCAGAHLARSS